MLFPSTDTLALILIAVLNLMTAFMTWRTKINVERVHKATNSMKDELVQAVSKSEHAAGREQGRTEGRAERK